MVKVLALYLQNSDEERTRDETEISKHVQNPYKVTQEVLAYTQQLKSTLDGRIIKDQHKEDIDQIAKSFAPVKGGVTDLG